MDINDNIESPFVTKVSFNKILNQYENLIAADNDFIAANARRVLKIAEENPILREGFSDYQLFETYEKEIEGILQDAFSPILTKNEIKTASVPFHNFIFNASERFKSILKTAGGDFNLQITNMPTDQKYIVACAIILNFCYGYNLNFKRPFFYEIPDADGIMRYYKILYNADFTEVIPRKGAPKITQADYDELLDSFENIELWKEKFPPNSYDYKGFVISNIFDVTDDQSISNIKSSLIGEEKRKDESFMNSFHEIFRSLLGLKDIKVGFSIYIEEEERLEKVHGIGLESYLLNDNSSLKSSEAMCSWSYQTLMKDKKFYAISDVDKFYKISKGKSPQYKTLKAQGIKCYFGSYCK